MSNFVKHKYQVQLATHESLKRAVARVFQRTLFEQPDVELRDHKRLTTEADTSMDVVGLCDEILGAAILRGASDIHLIPAANELLVHLRVDGELELYRCLPSAAQSGIVSRLKVLAGMDIAERRAAQDGRIRSHVGHEKMPIEMRVATLPTRYGERMTLRLLGSQNGHLSLTGWGCASRISPRLSALRRGRMD